MSDEDNVVTLNMVTKLPVPVERVLQSALEAGLTEVIVIGYTAEGAEYFSASEADGPTNVWNLERAKFKLMVIADAHADDPQRRR